MKARNVAPMKSGLCIARRKLQTLTQCRRDYALRMGHRRVRHLVPGGGVRLSGFMFPERLDCLSHWPSMVGRFHV